MTDKNSIDEIPDEIAQITRQLLAGDGVQKVDLFRCGEWWCKHAGEDNVVSDLIGLELYIRREPLTPHEKERIEDERDMVIYHLRDDYPQIIPEGRV